MSFLPLVKLWVGASVLATVAGWILSALGQLNRTGYLLFFGVVVIVLFLCGWKRSDWVGQCKFRKLWKARRRFRRFLPACFAVLAFLVFLGALLYPPTNHAGLTYRVPRVLQWLADGHWFWIHTPNYRMNDRACGIEWLTAPLLLFTKSDRSLFLVNFVPFLLLPGLIFSVFTRLGVKARVAFQWMWLLPTGYNFLLQAGSIGNDTFPTVYALAAVDFGLRAWESRRASDLWFSILSAALLTGAKASNMPLLLPWVILAFYLFRVLKPKPAITSSVILIAALVSFFPTAALNVIYCGDWSGLKLERPGMGMRNPIVGIWGNSLLFLLNNFAPPFFPQAGWWNQNALSIMPKAVTAPMLANFENGFHMLWEMPTEDWVGVGFGVSVLALMALFVSLRTGLSVQRVVAVSSRIPGWLRYGVLVTPWLALLAYCMKSGMVTGARLISPYYPLLIPALLLGPRQGILIRGRLWRGTAAAVLLLAFPVLVLTPARPLWPAQTLLTKLQQIRPENRLICRGVSAYAVYGERSDPLASVRSLLPKGLSVVGFMADGDDIDLSLWRPFFERKVKHVLLSDTRTQIKDGGIEYVVVGGAYLAASGTTLAAWQQRIGADILAQTNATLKVSEGAQTWYILRLRDTRDQVLLKE